MWFLAAILLLQISSGAAVSKCDPLYKICNAPSGYCDPPSNLHLTVGSASYDYSDFNAISFGDYNTNQGDIEGRLAVQGTFSAPNTQLGFTIGYQLNASDVATLPYSAVFNGNADWEDGEIYPLPNAKIFGGGTFTGAQNLKNKVSASCPGNTPGCLTNDFNTMKNYFIGASGLLSNNADNAVSTITNGKLTVDCSQGVKDVYFVTISVSDFNTVTDYGMTSCPSSAYFVFNIVGSGTVNFQGNAFGSPATVYNVISASNVDVQATVMGSILAPNSVYDQDAGYVEGQVVASTFQTTLQINHPQCPQGSGGAVGDPMIIGFNKKLKFWFNGWVGGVFNLYNDEYLNANSLFQQANEKNGTVMETIAVETNGHRISFSIKSPHDNSSMSILVDGKNTTVTASSIIYLPGCIEIGMKAGKHLSIRTPLHDLKIKLGCPTGDGYITVHHLDFDINPPKKNHHKVGGVIGQTASNKSDKEDKHFSVNELYGTEKSQFYKKTKFTC